MTDEQSVALVEAVRIEARGKVSEITLTGCNERLPMLEERMDRWENQSGEACMSRRKTSIGNAR